MALAAWPLPAGPRQFLLEKVLAYSRLDSLNSLLCSLLAEKRNVAHLNTWGKVTDCLTTYCSVPEEAELESIVKREGYRNASRTDNPYPLANKGE